MNDRLCVCARCCSRGFFRQRQSVARREGSGLFRKLPNCVHQKFLCCCHWREAVVHSLHPSGWFATPLPPCPRWTNSLQLAEYKRWIKPGFCGHSSCNCNLNREVSRCIYSWLIQKCGGAHIISQRQRRTGLEDWQLFAQVASYLSTIPQLLYMS